jgi:hypothetical protein
MSRRAASNCSRLRGPTELEAMDDTLPLWRGWAIERSPGI